jgi:hypothetical protein
MAFALQLRKKHGKTSVRIGEECQLIKTRKRMWLLNKYYDIISTCRLSSYCFVFNCIENWIATILALKLILLSENNAYN